MGPIPYSKIQERAVQEELSPAMMDLFTWVVRCLDREYMKWTTSEGKKLSKQQADNASAKANKGRVKKQQRR